MNTSCKGVVQCRPANAEDATIGTTVASSSAIASVRRKAQNESMRLAAAS